ncbi:MAG: peptide-methionine (R)-S-oxide reductase MsrB [Candidatus Nanohaloarchaea archaeon]
MKDRIQNLSQRLMGSRRRKVVGISALVSLFIIVLYADLVISGTMWALGTQNLSVEDTRFEGNSPEASPHWIQQSYQEEIQNLSGREYQVTQENGTEPPFRNEFYDHKKQGIYVDVVSGEPLFSSRHKFDSGTGWPSFYRPLEPGNIVERKDPGPLGYRVEVRSNYADSHLGHLFRNPNTPTGLRYCINSAALEFIPAEKLEEKGYGKYASMFETESSG